MAAGGKNKASLEEYDRKNNTQIISDTTLILLKESVDFASKINYNQPNLQIYEIWLRLCS